MDNTLQQVVAATMEEVVNTYYDELDKQGLLGYYTQEDVEEEVIKRTREKVEQAIRNAAEAYKG